MEEVENLNEILNRAAKRACQNRMDWFKKEALEAQEATQEDVGEVIPVDSTTESAEEESPSEVVIERKIIKTENLTKKRGRKLGSKNKPKMKKDGLEPS